jgi:RNA polymerase sigma-70 factor (ECF subfamily)
MSARYDRLCRTADEELMRLVGAADPDAFEVVYDRHVDAAYALAHRICGTRPAADDAVQEAFLAVWRSGARYDPAVGSVRSWVLSITHNRAIDGLRRLTRRQEAALPEELPARGDDAPGPEQLALQSAEAADTRRLLAQLPADQRKVIELSFYSGYSHSEIAELLDLPLGTVKGRMRLGLERVRQALTGGAA